MKRLIKTVSYTEEERARIGLGTGTRLDPKRQRVELKPRADGTFDTAAGGFNVYSWVINPETCRQWLGFQAFEDHPRDVNLDVATPIKYRLSNGTDQYHWDGAAWVVNTALWNTEAEIAANIATFPATTKQLQVIANLSTQNKKYTPALMGFKVLYATDVDFQHDLIYRSLVRALRENIRAESDWPLKVPGTGSITSFTLDDIQTRLDTPYQIVDVQGAFATDGKTGDTGFNNNLLDSYDPETRLLTLSTSVAGGSALWLKFEYGPEVMVHTSRDFIEIGKVPAVVLSDINVSSTFDGGQDDHIVLDKATGAAVKVPPPKQHDFDVVARVLTDKAADLQRLQEAVRAWIRTNPLLRARGIDELYGLQILNHYDYQGVSDGAEVHSGRIRFRILKALFYDRPDEDAFATVRFTLRGPPNGIVS